VDHRRHGSKRPLPEPDGGEEEATHQSSASQSLASSAPSSSQERHFQRRQQQQIELGGGRRGGGHDDHYYSPAAPAPARYHEQAAQQGVYSSSTMAYYDVGTRSSASSSHQPSDMAAAAVPVATGSPHLRVPLEAGAAGSSATRQAVDVQEGTAFFFLLIQSMKTCMRILIHSLYYGTTKQPNQPMLLQAMARPSQLLATISSIDQYS